MKRNVLIFTMMLVALMTVSSARAKEAYAIFNTGSMTLTFYYDDQKHEREFYGTAYSVEPVTWTANNMSVYSVFIDPSFAAYAPTSTSRWFENCMNITSIDGLEYLNTSEVTDMSYMFSGCSYLEELDLSGFDTGKVTNMSNMFSDCSSLVTIRVGEGWTTSSVTSSNDMFYGCQSLRGGNGTSFDDNKTDKTYARIDGGDDGQGYLTGMVAYVVYNSFSRIMTFYYDDKKLDRQGDGSVYSLGNVTMAGNDIESVTFNSSFAQYKPTSTSHWFDNKSFLSSFDGLQYLNTSNVTDMSSMFSGCSSLTSLDLRGFDTGQVTDMSNMFSGCSSLKTIRVDEGWKTSSVTSSDCMFDGCQSLIGGNGTRYSDMGVADKTYAHIDGGDDGQGYLTGKIAYAVYNSGSYYLTFYYDDNNLNRQSEGTVYTLGRRTWTAYTVETAEFKSSFADYKPTSTSGWFENVSRLYEIKGLEYLNTSEVTDMSSMFSGCSSLVELDLLGFETGKVTDMSNMFSGCSSLVTIIVGDGWNTSSVMESSSMFERCSNIIGGNGTRYNAGFTDKTYARVDGRGGQGYLTAKQAYVVYDSFAKILTFYYDLDISKNNGSPVGLKTWGFDIDRVEFTRAFADYKPTSTSHWFEGCSNLSSESIDGLQYLNTSEVTDMSSMFSGCSSLTSLDLSGFDTGKVTDMSNMFSGCSSLVTITVGDGWTTGSVTSDYGMFDGCQELKGGNGTVYNASHTDQTYARVDGRDGPGYLTAKEGIATGVGSVGNGLSSADAPMFNLQGQRVNDSYRGVVIQNGRKVLKK